METWLGKEVVFSQAPTCSYPSGEARELALVLGEHLQLPRDKSIDAPLRWPDVLPRWREIPGGEAGRWDEGTRRVAAPNSACRIQVDYAVTRHQ